MRPDSLDLELAGKSIRKSRSRAPSRASADDALDLGAADVTRRVSTMVRTLRAARGWSLADLAARAGVSRASLSQIETGKTNPSLAILWRIATGLGIPFAELLGADTPTGVIVLPRDQQRVLRSADGHLESRPLTVARSLPEVEIYELRLAAHGVHASEAHAPGTRECVVVLLGRVRLRIGDETHELHTGDAAVFAADQPHTYENPGRTECRLHDVIVYAGAR